MLKIRYVLINFHVKETNFSIANDSWTLGLIFYAILIIMSFLSNKLSGFLSNID